MFKKLIFLVLAAVMLICSSVSAKDRNFGLGIILGQPTGLSAKLWTGKNTAIDAALAWSFTGNGALYVHADYLLHNFDLIRVEKGQLPVYFGIGARVMLASNAGVGVRIPIGLNYLFAGAPLDIFLEVVPVLDLVPSTAFTVNGGIGVRYFFK